MCTGLSSLWFMETICKTVEEVFLDELNLSHDIFHLGMGKHIDWKTYEEGLAIAKQE